MEKLLKQKNARWLIMKIVNDKKPEKKIDLDSLIEEAFQKYDAVFFSDIED